MYKHVELVLDFVFDKHFFIK